MQQRNLWTVFPLLVMAAALACGGGDAPAPAAPAAPVFCLWDFAWFQWNFACILQKIPLFCFLGSQSL